MESGPKNENIQSPDEENGGPESIENLADSVEISPANEEGVAICVIKPDAFGQRDAIVRRLEDSGLYIVERRERDLSENFVVNVMRGGIKMPKPIEDAHVRHFLSGPSEILLVKGNDVIEKLLNTVGLNTNPALCEPETIRYIYGTHVPEELEGGFKYYRNAAHRPKDKMEAEEDREKFRNV
jgi:nucleoside diphosphate kinase